MSHRIIRDTNTAGIIVATGQPLDYSFTPHPLLLPVNKNYNLLERSIVECCSIRCDSVWVLLEEESVNELKKVVGERKYNTYTRKYIPIYWMPIKHENVSKDISWHISFAGSYVAFVHTSYSKFTTPRQYFFTFPYTILSPLEIKFVKTPPTKKKNVLFFCCKEENALSNSSLLPFILTDTEIRNMNKTYKNFKHLQILNKSEKECGLDKFLKMLILNLQDIKCFDVSTYQNVSTWEKWTQMINGEPSCERPTWL